ncbi:MAG: RNA methyltransferase [Lachnospiraceae bacterium]|nr:RNA methyltransferase [Lachnospiraceae bacterium]
MDEKNLNLIFIQDLEAPYLSVFSHASEAELLHLYEPHGGVFMAETANVILRALESGYQVESMLVEDKRLHIEAAPVFEKIESLYGREVLRQIPVYVADHETVKNLTGYNLVRGLWAVMKRKPVSSVEEFCRDKNRIAVLYDVVNPTNVGAIIRSAAALGMDGCLLTDHSVDPLTRRSTRVSMGTVFQIPWTVAPAGTDLAKVFKKLGFETAAMALTDDTIEPDNERLKSAERLAVFLGTEGTGLPSDVIDACDHRVCIPMYHGVDSLNVAAASAVIFWELSKKN